MTFDAVGRQAGRGLHAMPSLLRIIPLQPGHLSDNEPLQPVPAHLNKTTAETP